MGLPTPGGPVQAGTQPLRPLAVVCTPSGAGQYTYYHYTVTINPHTSRLVICIPVADMFLSVIQRVLEDPFSSPPRSPLQDAPSCPDPCPTDANPTSHLNVNCTSMCDSSSGPSDLGSDSEPVGDSNHQAAPSIPQQHITHVHLHLDIQRKPDAVHLLQRQHKLCQAIHQCVQAQLVDLMLQR